MDRAGERLIPRLVFWLAICLFALPAQAKYGGGTGEPNNPYLIYTAEQMNTIGAEPNDWDKHFKLMADIDLGGYTASNFRMIGDYYGARFCGAFDGNGRAVRNFTYTDDYGHVGVGLFGALERGEIKDLVLVDPNVGGANHHYVGALVGYSQGCSITRCAVRGGRVRGADDVGGLVGHNIGDIRECVSSAEIIGGSGAGGLVGYLHYGVIANCYSLAAVRGTTAVGGLVGYCSYQGAIGHCYSAGQVQGEMNVGGLVGLTHDGEIWCCFWDVQASSQTTSAAGAGRTTVEMRTAASFAGWGADWLWTINEGVDYPRLAWEKMPGEPFSTPVLPPFVGRGTLDEPYLIRTVDDLNTVGLWPSEWDKHYRLMADIDMSGYMWTTSNTIGRYLRYPSWGLRPFAGVFDGNGKTIRNFGHTSAPGGGYAGIFAYVEGAEIKDLGLIDPNIEAGRGSYAGALAGRLENATVTNCDVEGGNVSGGGTVGGLIGENYGSTVADCCVRCSLSGEGRVGGLVGWNRGQITRCDSSVQISATGGQVGGLVGDNSGTISDCTASASVSGATQVGGLVGKNMGKITDCCATGDVSGGEEVGGLVGGNNGTTASCYANGEVHGHKYVGGFAGQNGLNLVDVVWHGYIYDCYATGSVVGQTCVAGLVGYNDSWGTISSSYSTATVSGVTDIGGLVGQNRKGEVISSFWDIETSGRSTSAAGTGKTTDEMQKRGTFLAWGCDAIWTIDEGADYPRLVWENAPGDPITKPSYGGGGGTETDPYLIYTAEQLNQIGLVRCDWDKRFKLMADIDLGGWTGTDFNIIGYYAGYHSYNNRPFTGVFDGNGKIVTNFTYASTDKNAVGLFSFIGQNSEIKHLGLVNANVDGGTGWYVGVLVGYVEGGQVTGCYVEGGSVSGDREVGGLVGCVWGKDGSGTLTGCHFAGIVSGDYILGGLVGVSFGTVSNCSAEVHVTGRSSVGGLVGENYGRDLTNCHSMGTVTGQGSVGGLAGKNRVDAEIRNSSSSANVGTGDFAGGLAGSNWGTIANCYASGSVTGVKSVGGLVGYGPTHVVGSFWDIETSGQQESSGGEGKTTAEMQTESTFTEVGWDFVGESENGMEDIWAICEGQDYPKLTWQFVVGDFDGDDDTDFVDFCILAEHWLAADGSFWCGAGGTDITNDGNVDFEDLRYLADNWLAAEAICLD